MSTNLLLINTIILMVSVILFAQFNNYNNFVLAAMSVNNAINNRKVNINKGRCFNMMSNDNNSSNARIQKVLLQREKGLFSYKIDSKYTVYSFVGNESVLNSYKKGNKYLIPVNELKVVATNISFVEKCSLINGFKKANDWTSKPYSVDKMETFFWKSQKTGYAGLVGKNVNDSTTIFDIVYGLVLLGTHTVEQASNILRLALGFKGTEGKAGGNYVSFDRAKVSIDGTSETAILITPKRYNEFIASLKECTIEDHFLQIAQDGRFVFAYTSEKIIDSPKKDIGIDPTLLSVKGVKSSRTIKLAAKYNGKEVIGLPQVSKTKDLVIDSPQIRASKKLNDCTVNKLNALYNMDYTDDLINIDKLEDIAKIHSNKVGDVKRARFVYGTFSSGYALDISSVEEDDDTTIGFLTEERKELEGKIAQMVRTMFGKNIPAMIYLSFYAAYLKKISDKTIDKNNTPNNFPFIFREELITFINGSKSVECWENILINKYSEDDDESLRLVVNGVDVINGSVLSDNTINSVCEYIHSVGMLRHFVDITIPSYDDNEFVFMIKHEYGEEIVKEGDVAGISVNGKDVDLYINCKLAVCDVQHEANGYYMSVLDGRYGFVTRVITSQPWESKGEQLCYSVVTMKAEPIAVAEEVSTNDVDNSDVDDVADVDNSVDELESTDTDSSYEDETGLPDVDDFDGLSPDEIAEMLRSKGFTLESE